MNALQILISAQQKILDGRRFVDCTIQERCAYDVLTSARCYLMQNGVTA